jgi:hypothetical protein
MTRILLIGFIFLCFSSCEKNTDEKSTEQKLIGKWKFKEAPARLTNPWQGHCCEDRTIFSGNEHFSFLKKGDFIIDSTNYGTWRLDSLENIIIDMTQSGGYAVGDFPQPLLKLKIIELNDTLLKVDHSFYRFYPNYYILEPDK